MADNTPADRDDQRAANGDADIDATVDGHAADAADSREPTVPLDSPVVLFVAALLDAQNEQELLEDYCRRYPEHANELRAAFEFERKLREHGKLRQQNQPEPELDAHLPSEFDGFQIIRVIERGGMGTVYEALQTNLNRRVAIKTLRYESARPRFENEQRCLAQFYQANIVPLYQTGICHGIPYMVMPFIDGATLSKVVTMANRQLHVADSDMSASSIGKLAELCTARSPGDDRGGTRKHGDRSSMLARLSGVYYRSVARSVADIAHAIHDCHRLQIIHRDLKPGNVMVDKHGHAFIIDFGLASGGTAGEDGDANARKKVQIRSSLELLEASGLMGTPRYLAPEQLGGMCERVTDVWGIGTILYELLSFAPPYTDFLRTGPPVEVTDHNSRAPRDLAAIAMRCLSLDPAARYQSADEVAEELECWLRLLPVKARPWSVPERMTKWARRHTTTAASIALLSLGVIVAIVGLGLHGKSLGTVNTQLTKTLGELSVANTRAEHALTGTEQRERQIQRRAYATHMALASDAFRYGMVNAAVDLLRQDNTLNDGTDLRGWEWYALAAACGDDLLTLKGHEAPVTSVASDPHRGRIYSGDALGKLKIWRRENDQCVMTIDAHNGPINAIALDPDGRQVATAGEYDALVKIWSIGDGQLQATLRAHVLGVSDVVFDARESRWITSGRDGTVFEWSQFGKELRRFEFGESIADVDLSPDGKTLAVAMSHAVSTLDLETGKQLHQMVCRRTLRAVCFSPNGELILAAGNGGECFVWVAVTGELRGVIETQNAMVNGLATIAGNNAFATASDDGMVKVYDANNGPGFGRVLQVIRGHLDRVTCLVVDQQHAEITSGSMDGTVKVWGGLSGKSRRVLAGHAVNIMGLSFSRDGQHLASGSYDQSVRVWDLKGDGAPVIMGKQVVERDPESGQVTSIASTSGHSSLVMDVAFDPSGTRVASAGFDKTARIWDSESGKELVKITHRGEVIAVAFSPDGKLLATGSWDDCAYIWNVQTGKQVHQLEGHTGHIEDVAFSPTGDQLATASRDGTVRIWSVREGKLLRTISEHREQVNCVAFSPDGALVASGGEDRIIYVIAVATGNRVMTLQGHNGAVRALSFHPTQPRLASSTSSPADRTVRIWDLTTGEQTARLVGQRPVAFSPDGSRLAFGGTQNTIEIWTGSASRHQLAVVAPLKAGPGPQADMELPEDGGLRTLGYFVAKSLPDIRKPGKVFDAGDDMQFLVVVLSAPQKLFMPPAPVYQILQRSAAKEGSLLAAQDRIAIHAAGLFSLSSADRPNAKASVAVCLSSWPGGGGFYTQATQTRSEPLTVRDRVAFAVAWKVDTATVSAVEGGSLRINFKGRQPVLVVNRKLRTTNLNKPLLPSK